MKYIPAKKLIANLRRQKHELELSIQSQGDFGQSGKENDKMNSKQGFPKLSLPVRKFRKPLL